MKYMAAAMRVNGVVLDGETGEPDVILEEIGRGRFLHVPVGPFEASAIIIELEGILPPRPLTHDLMVSLFKTHGLFLDYIELYGTHDGSLLARMVYHDHTTRFEQEVRPSDGLALSVRMRAPVFAEESVMMAQARYPERIQARKEHSHEESIKVDWTPRQ